MINNDIIKPSLGTHFVSITAAMHRRSLRTRRRQPRSLAWSWLCAGSWCRRGRLHRQPQTATGASTSQASGELFSCDCSYCTSTGQCSANHGVSCGGGRTYGGSVSPKLVPHALTPSCPRPPPPPPPVVKYACDTTNAVCFPHPTGADTNKTRCDAACGSSAGCECQKTGK